ncbi:cytochrome c oxidase subunit NDUFA4-like [Coccinella septempunctata]|uniref:cytochrome c oxidase subunit NDUFA4-like n=1 Tax=Coccinella septempunctata TaxID=41139 RepID=UPI001D069296|nr:cytochrome c oxidase subunit NDUFA4-like [Coccinella septempunctata]
MKKSLSFLKRNYSLIPLLLIVGGGVAAASCFGLRVAMYHPEVYWKKTSTRNYEKNPYKKLWWYFDEPLENWEKTSDSA